MNKRTWTFNELGTIPGVPGNFHAGQQVDVDMDTMTVLEVRPAPAVEVPEKEAPPDSPEKVMKDDKVSETPPVSTPEAATIDKKEGV